MQFFPTSSSEGLNSFVNQTNSQSSGASDMFGDILAEAGSRTMAELDSVASRGLDSSSISNGISRINKAKDDTLEQSDKLTVTLEDLAGMKDSLKEFGLSDEDIDDLEDSIRNSEGMSWNAFLGLLADKVGGKLQDLLPSELSTEQTRLLQNLFQKLGFTTAEADGLMGKIVAGRLNEVFSAVSEKLGKLPLDQFSAINSQEIAALTKALKLSDDAAKRVMSAFEQLSAGEMSKDELKALLASLKQEVAKNQQEISERLSALRDGLQDALRQAMDRAQQLKESGGRESSQVQQVKTVGEDKLTHDASLSAKDVGERKNGAQDGEFLNDSGAKNHGKGESGSKDAIWASFLSKLGFEGSLESKAGDFRYDALLSRENFSSSQLLDQVNNGILRTLADGGRQLQLQLTPADLGNVTVVLSVNANKEVSAVIRPENADAAKMLAENMHHLKQALEQQGLKVQKLDVQTQTPNDRGGNDWTSAQQHNEAREQREMLERSSFLRQLNRRSGVVAQNVQSSDTVAHLSHNGIYIVA